jgi:hypothetical protein
MTSDSPAATMLRKHKSIHRELKGNAKLLQVRIALLSGSTANEFALLLQLLLMARGIEPVFYFSDYNRYFEEAVLDNSRLIEFKPDIAIVYTSSINIREWPRPNTPEIELNAYVNAEKSRFTAIWDGLHRIGSAIIQNNFECPFHRPLGNYEAVSPAG